MSPPVAVVAGALANKPGNGGESWVRLSWVKGLARLGFDVHLVEEIDAASFSGSDGRPAAAAGSRNLKWFREVTASHGMADASTLVVTGGRGAHPTTHGLAWDDLLDVADTADLLVNISGNLRQPALLDRFRNRAYVDLDPGWTQVWDAQGADLGLDDHHLLATVGANVGTPGCDVPVGGRRWLPVRQPVVLDDWCASAPPATGAFTTVATWRCPFGPLDVGGRRMGTKVHEFRRFADVARGSGERLELALDVHPADAGDRALMEASGWSVVDASAVASTPEAFAAYVRSSAAEWSVAQGVYVGLGTGWFSDRSVRYLASGRPVVVQDTGLARSLPLGDGLLAFDDLPEAVGAVSSVASDLERHGRAARQIAEDWFDSDLVLSGFLDHVAVGVG